MSSQLKVIGAGFGRTGTFSLKAALEELGFGPCYHMTEVFEHPEHAGSWEAAWRGQPVDWDALLGGYEAALDWPACTFYAKLMEHYPDAKVILTVRNAERWYESMRDSIYQLSVVIPRSPLYGVVFALFGGFLPGAPARGNMGDEIIWEGTFEGRFEDKNYAIEVFERHNEEVKRNVPPEKLLVYEVKEGWAPLCEFLGVEAPDKPFPHLNDAAQMRRRVWGMRALSAAVPAALALAAILAFAFLRKHARRS